MRSLLFTLVFGVLMLRIFWYPETAVYLWAWLSIMNPHTLTYGFAQSVPWAQISAIAAVLVLLVSKSRKPFPWNSVTAFYLALVVWVTVTATFSINDRELVWDRWMFVMKIHFMMVITLMMLRGRAQIEVLIWIVAGSIAFYGVKGGLWTIMTGGGGRVWGPPGGMIAGNNEIAVAMVMTVPLLYYLLQTHARWYLRWGLGLAIGTMAFAILGTQSRGAFLALLAMMLVLGLKGKYPIRTSAAILCLVALAVAFMPESWTKRMDTIQDYTADSSAMARIYTWKTIWAVAQDRPVLGAGFGIDNEELFSKYAPRDPEFVALRGRPFVAHSIYFQALGEHGFVGLLIYLLIGIMTYRMAGRLSATAEKDAEFSGWVPLLMRMVQVSIVGFAVGGAFLSLMDLDVPFYLLAFVVLTEATVRESLKVRAHALTTPRIAIRSSSRNAHQ